MLGYFCDKRAFGFLGRRSSWELLSQGAGREVQVCFKQHLAWVCAPRAGNVLIEASCQVFRMTESQEKGGVDSHFLNCKAHMGERRASLTRSPGGSWEKGWVAGQCPQRWACSGMTIPSEGVNNPRALPTPELKSFSLTSCRTNWIRAESVGPVLSGWRGCSPPQRVTWKARLRLGDPQRM